MTRIFKRAFADYNGIVDYRVFLARLVYGILLNRISVGNSGIQNAVHVEEGLNFKDYAVNADPTVWSPVDDFELTVTIPLNARGYVGVWKLFFTTPSSWI